MTNGKYRYQMRSSGDSTDIDGCTVDAEGITWCDAPSLRKKAGRLERGALAHAAHGSVFKRAEGESVSDEPTVAGGVLDAMAPGLMARWNGK